MWRSSRVCSLSQPMPKRSRMTFSSLGERIFRMPAVSSRTFPSLMASTGEPTERSSMKSPSADSPSRPTRRFKRHRVAQDGFQRLHLSDRNVHAPANLVAGRRVTQLFFELARSPQELVYALVHVHRDADGARLVRNGPRDRLADPPGGVSRELVAAPVVEFIGPAHQPDVAFLDQVQQVQSVVQVFLSNRN